MAVPNIRDKATAFAAGATRRAIFTRLFMFPPVWGLLPIISLVLRRAPSTGAFQRRQVFKIGSALSPCSSLRVDMPGRTALRFDDRLDFPSPPLISAASLSAT